jgi:hypothetical protein
MNRAGDVDDLSAQCRPARLRMASAGDYSGRTEQMVGVCRATPVPSSLRTTSAVTAFVRVAICPSRRGGARRSLAVRGVWYRAGSSVGFPGAREHDEAIDVAAPDQVVGGGGVTPNALTYLPSTSVNPRSERSGALS